MTQSLGPAAELNTRPPVRQPGALPTEPPVHGINCLWLHCLDNVTQPREVWYGDVTSTGRVVGQTNDDVREAAWAASRS